MSRALTKAPSRLLWNRCFSQSARQLQYAAKPGNATSQRQQPGSDSRLLTTFAVSALAATGGYLASQLLQSTEPRAPSPDLSTTPLHTLSPPEYASDAEFAEALKHITAVVGKENVNSDETVVLSHADSFFSTHHPPKPDKQRPAVVVYPASTEQVSEILKIAHRFRVPIVANSGLTSLEGHNMHTRGPNSISLAFGNLNDVIKLNAGDLDVQVQAGVGWQELDEYLQSSDDGSHLMFGPDPGVGATIAGMVGTSASGTNAYKYGTMKENVVSLTVVLADGTIVRTRQRPRKSSAGYDLTRLFIGSEGTLGIITEITVKLHPRPKRELVSIASFPTIKDAASTASYIISKSGIQLNAIELMNETMMSFVNDSGSLEKTFQELPTLLFKVGGPSENAIQEQLDIIEKIAREHNASTFESSKSKEDNEVLWGARRAGLWSTFDYGSKVLENKDDVQIWTTDFTVPISQMAKLINETNEDLLASGFKDRFSVLGHVGDGNCHFLVIYNSKDYTRVKSVVDRMVSRALKLEGTCTGEHGVGVGKRAYLEPELGVSAVDLMRQVKLALDPRRILNPDKVFKIDPLDDLDELLESGHVHENPKCC